MYQASITIVGQGKTESEALNELSFELNELSRRMDAGDSGEEVTEIYIEEIK